MIELYVPEQDELQFLQRSITREQLRESKITFVLAKPEEADVLSELRRQVWETTYRGI